MLTKQIKQNPVEYLALLFILIAGAVAFILCPYHPYWQRRVIYSTSAAYFAWSLYHHHRRGDLDVSIIIEYLLFALFAIILVSSTLI